jgi:long-chain acyl-CoA synthetase
VLYSHPDVDAAAVIGVPDRDWGEAVKAVVVIKPGSTLDAETLIAFCKQRLSGYKVPKSVEFRTALPLTAIGKVNKVALREMILAAADQAVQ